MISTVEFPWAWSLVMDKIIEYGMNRKMDLYCILKRKNFSTRHDMLIEKEFDLCDSIPQVFKRTFEWDDLNFSCICALWIIARGLQKYSTKLFDKESEFLVFSQCFLA